MQNDEWSLFDFFIVFCVSFFQNIVVASQLFYWLYAPQVRRKKVFKKR